jgi:hypothetical protein
MVLQEGSSPGRDVHLSITLDAGSAERILTRNREQLVPVFPFVPVLSSVSAQDITREHHFIFTVIANVVNQPGKATQGPFNQWFRRYLAEKQLAEEHRMLEMLQAILVFTAWCVSSNFQNTA